MWLIFDSVRLSSCLVGSARYMLVVLVRDDIFLGRLLLIGLRATASVVVKSLTTMRGLLGRSADLRCDWCWFCSSRCVVDWFRSVSAKSFRLCGAYEPFILHLCLICEGCTWNSLRILVVGPSSCRSFLCIGSALGQIVAYNITRIC